MIGSQGGMFSDYLPEAAARDVYASGDAICAGSFGPTGRAIPVESGYRLTGRWAFASGCKHATWLVCGALIMENGQPRMRENGAPDIQILYVPAREGRILDTWYSGGLRGTGSHDIELDDVFVPQERCFAFASLAVGPAERASTGYTQPFVSLASVGMAALALGIARDALDSFKQLATEKTPSSGSLKLMAQPVVQDRYAEAVALVASSRLYFYDAAEQLAASAHPTPDVLTLVRLACAHAVRSCERAVEIVYSLGGGTAVYTTSRLDRCFRDVHTLSHHIAVSPSHFEMAGQYLLGGEMQARR
jgi:alkylation response protein AidB-like acyl-CoA dehydrogenase